MRSDPYMRLDYNSSSMSGRNTDAYRTPSAIALRKDGGGQRSGLGQAGLQAMGSQQEMNQYNSNSANFGMESLKFNNHYYNLDHQRDTAGSRNYNQSDPYSQQDASPLAANKKMNGRHDANPNALKNMNYIKKYQSVGQSMNRPKHTIEDIEREA